VTSSDKSAMDPRDHALLDELRTALDAADPVPDTVVSAAQSAFTWLTIDAELAALAEDSLLAGASVRSTATARSLTSDRPADLQILHRGGTLTLATDEHGRFRVEHVMSGPVSVRCVFTDDPDNPIITSWVVV
jgi:hypothetical protein